MAFRFGAFAHALAAVGGGEVRSETYAGRPAWVVSADLEAGSAARDAASAAPDATSRAATPDRLSVTVDQEAGLPVRIQFLRAGVATLEQRLENVRVDRRCRRGRSRSRCPKGRRSAAPIGASIPSRSSGSQLASGVSRWYPPIFPTDRPPCAATAARSTAPEARLAGTAIVSLRYERGFDVLSVTTRTIADPWAAAGRDPFVHEWTGSKWGPTQVRLTSGAFAGATARVLVAPLTTPHLWSRMHVAYHQRHRDGRRAVRGRQFHGGVTVTHGCRRLTTVRASFAVVLLCCAAAALIAALAAGCEDEPSSDSGGPSASPTPAASPVAVDEVADVGSSLARSARGSATARERRRVLRHGQVYRQHRRGTRDRGRRRAAGARGAVDMYRVKVSDLRASGTLTVTVNQDQRGDGSADSWGSWVLKNAGGSWVCERWTGSVWKGGLGVFTYGVGEGRGAYAGLRSDSCWHINLEAGATMDTRIFGVIQKAK